MKKRNRKEDFKLIIRSIKEIHRISPGHMGAALCQAVFAAVSPFITLYMSALILNGIVNKEEGRRLFFYAAAAVTAGLAVHLLTSFFNRLLNGMSYRFWPCCRMAVSGKMMELDYADVESPKTHQLRQKIQDYENTGGEGLGNLLWQFRSMVSNLFTLGCSISLTLSLFTASCQGNARGALAFAVSPWASVILLAAILLNGFAGMAFGGKMLKKSHALMGEVIAANRIYGYYLENHVLTYHTGKDIRIYGQKAVVEEEMQEHYDMGKRMVEGQTRNEAKYSGAIAAFTVALSTLVYLFVGLRALAGMIGIGDVVLYIGSISRFTEGFSGLVMALTRIRTNNDAMRAYFGFMDLPVKGRKEAGSSVEGTLDLRSRKPSAAAVCGKENRLGTAESGIRKPSAAAGCGKENQPGTAESGIRKPSAAAGCGKGNQPGTAENGSRKLSGEGVSTGTKDGRGTGEKAGYEVEFCNVSFRYPGMETWALRHVSLKFGAGERLAVVGQNGSGKTTFIKLLCRLYEPDEGAILLNGVDIREYRREEYRKIMSVVFQDFQLFSFSLAQNVAAGMNPDGDRVRESLQRAGFGERLSDMPRGIDTCLYKDFEEEGVEISGGEAQKIALARALYKDALIVVLDEPTAALDPVAEYEIYSSFNGIVGDRTAVYISHRLASCRFCDDIAVFHKGELVQRGTHEELVARKEGKYFELWTAQAQHYVGEGR